MGEKNTKFLKLSAKIYLAIFPIGGAIEVEGLTPTLMPEYSELSSINMPNLIKIHNGVLWAAIDSLCKKYSDSEKLY